MHYEIKTQLIVSLPNQPGSLAALSELLAAHQVSIDALAVDTSTQESGSFRILPSDPLDAKRTLERNGYAVGMNDVLCIRLLDSRGRLAAISKALSDSAINIDYIYASVADGGIGSLLVMKLSNIPLACAVLEQMEVAA